MEQARLVEEIEAEAEYTLESHVKCASCGEELRSVQVVRLLRTRVNFTSSLPRRGYVVTCPTCHTVVPAGLG
jgi:ribosomal protein L34E